jgi:hypothetical protein
VLYNNGDEAYIPFTVTAVDTENSAHLRCFIGNEEEGYRLYNMEAGATKVLAAPIEMKGNTGAGSYLTNGSLVELPKYDGYVCEMGDIYVMGAEDTVLDLNYRLVTNIEGASVVDANRENVIYDLSGRRVLVPSKGLYIVNGKKVIFK